MKATLWQHLGRNPQGSKKRTFLIGLLSFALTACNAKLFNERPSETPAPSDERIEKSFFQDPSGKPKTFLCGWAPVSTRGEYGHYNTHLVHEMAHCNVEFEVTQNHLVGRMLNPSEPNNRGLYREVFRIPIQKHFYYEKDKDQYGRELNKFIENERSDWSARPMMKLNLSGMQTSEIMFGYGVDVTSVKEIEWDRENNFLGFTLSAKLPGNNWFSTEVQADYRVNFLKFDHDPSFKRVPYHQENSKYMNILHVMGIREEGIAPSYYVARWDFSKPQKMYVSGAPKHVQPLLLTAIEKWNQTFEKIGIVKKGQKAFEPVVKDLAHPFDLRYTNLTWVDDKRISAHAPLGIGMAHADVRNGKILWGSAVIYGGMIEKYVTAYAPTDSAASASSPAARVLPLMESLTQVPARFNIPQTFKSLDLGFKDRLVEEMLKLHGGDLAAKLNAQNVKNLKPQEVEALKKELDLLKQQWTAKSQGGTLPFERIVADLLQQVGRTSSDSDRQFSQNSVLKMMGFERQAKSEDYFLQANDSKRALLAKVAAEKNPEQQRRMLESYVPSASSVFLEEGRTFANMAGSWAASPAHKTRTLPEMFESVVVDLTLHEIGHVLGLGHQFKENILPKSGTVPSKLYESLKAKANEENHFTNYSSVMGYRHGKVEMMVPVKELAPGPHDELVLRYMYLGEYSTYDKESDQFKFFKVADGNGKIPLQTLDLQTKKSLPVAYFPACNDIEASLSADPFCNRWDRGSKAEEIVKSYFESLSDNLESNLYSLVGSSGDAMSAEWRLWGNALDHMSRVRLFYDEMRRRLRTEEKLKPLWERIRSSEEDLLAFSRGCTEGTENLSSTLKALFANEEIRDLCRANALAMNEFKFFLSLHESDYTRMDRSNRYASSGYLAGDGVRDYSHIFGSWYQLTNLPLKFTSLFNLTTSEPYAMGWGGMYYNYYYNGEEDRNLYRTLYPREYTQLIADAAKYNLTFASTGQDSVTTLGRSLLAAGWLVPMQRYTTNDSAKLPDSFNQMLNQQTSFDLSIVAVLISAVAPAADSGVKADHFQRFTGNIFDFFSGTNTATRDVFLLPDGNVFIRANRMFLYPITKLKFYSGTSSYVIAYKISYTHEVGDELYEDSVKFSLSELHDQVTGACVDGVAGSGLANYFQSGNTKFEGFYIPPQISTDSGKESEERFHDSLKTEFSKYEASVAEKVPSWAAGSMEKVCNEANRGVGQILSAGGLLNGYWLPLINEFLVK